jgi:hypothetical protein
LLDPQVQQQYSAQRFSELARRHVQRMGFEPTMAMVWACEEHNEEATAHVVLTGRAANKEMRYRDAVVLRRRGDDWRVLLPPNFEQTAKR